MLKLFSVRLAVSFRIQTKISASSDFFWLSSRILTEKSFLHSKEDMEDWSQGSSIKKKEEKKMKMQLSKYTVEVASKIPFFLFFCYCVGNYLLAQQIFANEGKKKKKIIGL